MHCHLLRLAPNNVYIRLVNFNDYFEFVRNNLKVQTVACCQNDTHPMLTAASTPSSIIDQTIVGIIEYAKNTSLNEITIDIMLFRPHNYQQKSLCTYLAEDWRPRARKEVVAVVPEDVGTLSNSVSSIISVI